MTRRLIICVPAEADMTDAALWYEQQQPGLGFEFLAEVDRAIHSALTNPRQFPCLRRKRVVF